MWDEIVGGAIAESPLWSSVLLPAEQQEREPAFAQLGPERHAAGLETVYEGYLVHYGRPRLFAFEDEATGLLLGDYLYAHGLVRVASTGDVEAVADLAALISLCAQGRAAGNDGDGAAWAATAACLGRGGLGPGRAALRESGDARPLEAIARSVAGADAVEAALAAHARRVG